MIEKKIKLKLFLKCRRKMIFLISDFIFLISDFLFLIFLLPSCSPVQKNETPEEQDPLVVVGFSQLGSESDWRKGNTQSMLEAFSPENGYRLIFDDAQQKQEKQITAIRNFINQGVDYIVLAPNTEQGWDTILAEAKAAGIPVIIVDRKIEVSDPDLFTCWVGSNFLSEGEIATDWMSRNLPETLKIVHLQGNLGSSAQIGRTEGLEKGLSEHPEWKLVFQAPGDFVQAKGQELIKSVLSEQIDFDVIYSENDNMTYGAIEALKENGIQPGKDVTIISFDASRDALRLIRDGEINLDVECNPNHGPRVRALIEQIERGETPRKYTYVAETYFEPSTVTEEIINQRGY